MRKYLLLIFTAMICAGLIVWKLIGITGSEMLYTFIGIWILPINIAFASGLTVYRNKLHIITFITAIVMTVALPLWCFGTYTPIPTALVVFCALLGAATSALFTKLKYSMK